MAGFVAAAVVTSAAIGAYSSNKAAGAQTSAANRATDAQTAMFERQVELQEPFREAGLKGQNRLLEYLGLGGDVNAPGYGKYATAEFTPEMFNQGKDPGYAFRMAEGMKALERSAAARGGLLSGSNLKNTQRFGQDLASQEYQNAFNRFQTQRTNTLNPFASLAGVAQSSANTLGTQAGQYGNAMASNIIGAGNAQASGYMGQANAIAGGVGQGINFYQNQQLMNRLPNYASTPTYSAGPELLAG